MNNNNKSQKAPGKRTLLFQIGITLVPLVLFILAHVSWTVYQSTINGFLTSQNDLMTERLNLAYDSIFYDTEGIHPINAWFLDYVEENAEICAGPVTKEEQAAFDAHEYDEGWWSLEWLEQMPKEVQTACAKTMLDEIQSSMSFIDEYINVSELLVMDVNEPHEGFVFCAHKRTVDGHSFADTIQYSLSDLPALQSLLENPSNRIVFDKTRNFPMKGSYYIAFKPVFYQGKIRAVMILPYSWGGLRHALTDILFKAFMTGVGGLVVSLLILLFLLYRKAIAPVKQIQHGIQDYIRTKDSAVADKSLGNIRERNEIGKLSKDLSAMVQEIDHYTEENIRLAGEREKTRTELTLAKSIQESMLSKDWPESERFTLAASMRPAKEVGGDFYDFFYIDDDRLAIVIADVSGKGIPAALFMMMCKTIIKNYAREGFSPSEVIERTNRCILEYKGSTMFVTVWLGIYETVTGHITAVNAGHEYPVIGKKDSDFELYKDAHSIAVGTFANIRFKEYEFDLEKGGTLFLYTDGVTEATNSENKLFGTGRLTDTLNLNKDGSPLELINTMRAAIDSFAGDTPQFDDITMLVIRRTE